MKVAELFAELGIKPDSASFRRAEQDLVRFSKKADQRVARAFNPRGGSRSAGGSGRGGLFGGLGGLGGVGLTAGLVGGGALVGAAKDALDFDAALTRLAVASDGAVGSMDAFQARVLDVSNATGLSKEEVLAGSASFVALTGDGRNAAAAMETFAKVARASGTPVGDIARAAASLKTNLDIDPSQFEDAFSVLIRGGKAGAVELNDFAGLLATLAPEAAKFKGGGGLEGLRELSALLQVTQRGAGSAGEAATQLSSLFGALSADLFRKKSGINVFNVSKDEQGRTVKTLKSMREIIDLIGASKLARDPALLREALGRKEAQRAVTSLLKHRDALDQIRIATIGAKDASEDFATVSESTSARFTTAWNRVKNAATKAITPVLEGAGTGLALLDPESRERKLVEDSSKRTIAGGVASAIVETAKATSLSGLFAPDEQLFPEGDIAAFSRPQARRARGLLAGTPSGNFVEVDAPATISTTINVTGGADPKEIGREVERQATPVIRREFERWARAVASEFGEDE